MPTKRKRTIKHLLRGSPIRPLHPHHQQRHYHSSIANTRTLSSVASVPLAVHLGAMPTLKRVPVKNSTPPTAFSSDTKPTPPSWRHQSSSSPDKNRRKKPRVTESLSPKFLLRDVSNKSPQHHGSPRNKSPSGSATDIGQGHKRKGAHSSSTLFSDTENIGDRKNEGWAAKRQRSFRESLLEDERQLDSGSEDKERTQKKLIFDVLSSDESDDELQHKNRKSPPGMSANNHQGRSTTVSTHAGTQQPWLKSYHASAHSDDSEESSSDSEDDIDSGIDWWKSSKRNEKLKYIESITSCNDKALQMLLWDIGFNYNIHPHQFEAIRFVAGYISTFPFVSQIKEKNEDDDVVEMLQMDRVGQYARKKTLDMKDNNMKRRGRGMILADEMGLGKTIEALAGAALRNYPCNHTKKLPTLIITPQDGVQDQWVTSLVEGGVEPSRITIIGEKKSDRRARVGKKESRAQGGIFIICTRYKVQSELKQLFNYSPTATTQKKKSLLFDKVPQQLIKKLHRQYLIEQGKEQAPMHSKNEPKTDRVTKIVAQSQLKKVFESVIIDEAHFLRNLLAYWGLGAAILGGSTKRTILLSGTPYNNRLSDMSSLMTFIDSGHEAARVKWWDSATSKRKADAIKTAVGAWKNEYMLRRDKSILGNKLPSRERSIIISPAVMAELGIYEYYECVFLKAMDQLQEEADDRKRQKEMVDIMMSCMACMRMSLIHPMLPKGREVTCQFSPSRKHLVLKREHDANKTRCVFCGDRTPTQNALRFEAVKSGDGNEELNFRELFGATAQEDEDILFDEYEGDKSRGGVKELVDDEEKGRIVEIGQQICRAAGSNCCHFAHERCLKIAEDEGFTNCPRCLDLEQRCLNNADKNKGKVYCRQVNTTISKHNGLSISAKLEKAVDWFKSIPKGDKVLILSFFKGSLDLLEGILTYEHGVSCCRYDGDVGINQRKLDLTKFKTDDECRVLLASVQSGGVGLNIVEANHVLFLDRWYNPQIHDQAESRCHRLKQTKDVKVAYLDTSYTADVVMRLVNTLKEDNAGIILADGTLLSRHVDVNYSELAGVLGENLKAIIAMRHNAVLQNAAIGNADAPLVFDDDFDLELELEKAVDTMRTVKKKPSFKKEYTSNFGNYGGNGLIGATSCDHSEEHWSEDSDDDIVNFPALFSVKSKSDSYKTDAAHSYYSGYNIKAEGGSVDKAKASINNRKVPRTEKLSTDFASADTSDDESDYELLYGKPMFRLPRLKSFKEEAKSPRQKSINEKHAWDTQTGGVQNRPYSISHKKSAKMIGKDESVCPKVSRITGKQEVIEILSSQEEEDGTEKHDASINGQVAALEEALGHAIDIQDWSRVTLINDKLKVLKDK